MQPSGVGIGAVPAATAPEQAPDATVLAGDGSKVQLASAWADATTVIIFYRGHWCPFCQRQLSELESRRGEFEKLRAHVIAVSSDLEDISMMKQHSGVTFELYADPDLAAIKAFNVLDKRNGIAKPAVVIVDAQSRVQFKHVGENASDRVTLDDLLATLASVQQQQGAI